MYRLQNPIKINILRGQKYIILSLICICRNKSAWEKTYLFHTSSISKPLMTFLPKEADLGFWTFHSFHIVSWGWSWHLGPSHLNKNYCDGHILQVRQSLNKRNLANCEKFNQHFPTRKIDNLNVLNQSTYLLKCEECRVVDR